MRGERLGPYRVQGTIDRGETGTVYRAVVEGTHPELRAGDVVAVKVLHPHVVAQPRAIKRLRREADLGRRVRHPNVVSFYGSDAVETPHGTVHFLVMELVEGRTLRSLLGELGRVPEALVREIAAQIADGLSAIHAVSAVHRDLKPENVLITADQHVRIMDLGMVRMQDEAMAVTGDGDFAGSLLYAAPELFRGERAGAGSDLYALGMMLYELVTGAHPFPGRTPVDVITAHLSRAPPVLRSVDSSVSPFLCAYVGRLLAKSPGDRPASAEEVCETFRRGERSPWWRARMASENARECALPEVPVSRRTALVGRAAQMDVLRTAWARALAGRGESVLISGETGIGKSRVVAEFLRGMEHTAVHAIYGAYGSDGGPGGLTTGLRRIVASAGGPVAGLERVLGDQAALARPLAEALGFGSELEPGSMLPAKSLHGVLARVVDGLAQERPVIWIVDDVHHAPPGSLELILSLIRAVPGRRVLLLLTTCPGPCEQMLLSLTDAARPELLRLSQLGDDDIGQMLLDLGRDEDAVRRLGPQIAKRAGGIPLFVVALWDEMRDRGWLDGDSGPVDTMPLPGAMRDVLLARLAVLAPRERELLEIGAVQGETFDPALVAAVLQESRLPVLRELAEVERRTGLLQPAGGRLRFDHREIREVLMDALEPLRRRELHTALADARVALDGARGPGDLTGGSVFFVARHHLLGARPHDALPYVTAALRFLRRGFRHEAAARLCRTVLDVDGLVAPEQAARLQLQLADHLHQLGRSEEQRDALDAALDLSRRAGDRRLEMTALTRIGALFAHSGHAQESLDVLDEALALADDDDPARIGAVRVHRGSALHRLGRLEEAREEFRAALDAAIEACDIGLEGMAAGALGNVTADLGIPRAAEKLQRRALRIARERGDLEAECRAAGNLGITMIGLGRHDEALLLFERQRALALATGDRTVAGRCDFNVGRLYRMRGDASAARACFERAIAAYDEMGDAQGLAMVLGNYGQMLVSLGDLVRAREILSRAHALLAETGGDRDRGYVLVSLAALERVEGRPDAALDLYRRGLQCHERTGGAPGIAEAALGLGTLLIESGRQDEGRALVERAWELSDKSGLWDTAVLAGLHLARFGAPLHKALDPLARHGRGLEPAARAEAHFVAWQLGGDPRQLQAAIAAREAILEHVAPEHRAGIDGQPLFRRIRTAAEGQDRSPPPP